MLEIEKMLYIYKRSDYIALNDVQQNNEKIKRNKAVQGKKIKIYI